MGVTHIERIIVLKILLEGEVAKEKEEEEISEAGRADNFKEKNLIFIAHGAIDMDVMHPHVSCLG